MFDYVHVLSSNNVCICRRNVDWSHICQIKYWLIDWMALNANFIIISLCQEQILYKKNPDLMVNITRIIFLTRLNSFQLNEKQRIPHCQNSSKVNRKTKNTTLSEVQRSTEKQRIPHCLNSPKVNRKTKNNTLSEMFKGQ